MRVLLVSGYELGHQPLHVARPAGILRARGHEIRIVDLSVDPWDPTAVDWAERVAFSVPMHTATRIARRAIEALRARRANLPVCCFGLYAQMAADVADYVVAGETDGALVDWVEGPVDRGLDANGTVRLGREAAAPGAPLPARDLLPALDRYAHLVTDDATVPRVVGYAEASHGCAHRCRHCPVPVVYDGRIRIVDELAVLADVAQQVEAGARHITFGDPDFFNGVHHSLRVVRAVHQRFPDVTFDCTVKVEHILRNESVWGGMADSGCLFVVSAFESVNDALLRLLDKGHTTSDAARAVALLRAHGIETRPSFMPFTPWTAPDDVRALLAFVAEHDLVENVDPVQYTIRMLVPRGSLLLELPELAPHLGSYDDARGSYSWTAADPELDVLAARLAALVESDVAAGRTITETYSAVCVAAGAPPPTSLPPLRGTPHLTEPWFCCAEPTTEQLGFDTAGELGRVDCA